MLAIVIFSRRKVRVLPIPELYTPKFVEENISKFKLIHMLWDFSQRYLLSVAVCSYILLYQIIRIEL